MQVAFAVTNRHERPEMAEDIPKKLRKLIQLCWDSDPHVRPTAKEVVIMLDKLIEDLAGARLLEAAVEDGDDTDLNLGAVPSS
eukprot:scaffold650659_cov42-Prasinocladus_malaysianus.AAC.1